jgi:cytoskeletal protein CcmA (bactofilin family)
MSKRDLARFVGALLVVLLASGTSAAAAESPLARAVRDRFEVLVIRDGVVLRPLNETVQVVGIEIRDGEIAIDGEVVEVDALPELVGEPEASLLMRLVDLEGAELREVFAPPAPPAPTPAPDVETTPTVAPTPQVPPVSAVPGVAPVPPAPRPPPPVQIRSGGSKVVFGSSAVVDADEEVEEVVAIGGSATVHGKVLRDVVAVGGSVEIEGEVGGNVTAVGGPVELGPNAVVDGEITSVGSTVETAPGAEHGKINEVSAPWLGGLLNLDRLDKGIGPRIIEGIEEAAKDHQSRFARDFEELVHRVVYLVVLGLLGALGAIVAPRAFRATGAAAGRSPLMAPVIGVLSALLFFPLLVIVTILLVISIVGIPLVLLVPFAAVAFLVLWVFGFAATVARVGELIESRLGRSGAALPIVLALGLIAVGGFGVAAHLIDLADGRSDILGFLSGVLGFSYFCLMAWAWFTGLGALLLARFQPVGTPAAWAAAPAAAGWAGPAPTPSPVVTTPDPLDPAKPWTEEEFLEAAQAELDRTTAEPAPQGSTDDATGDEAAPAQATSEATEDEPAERDDGEPDNADEKPRA